MADARSRALEALTEAQRHGFKWLMLRHGWSTSAGWKRTTVRSVIRGLMRGPDATPLIVRSESIQHGSVFVAAIREKRSPVDAEFASPNVATADHR
jgi:hypothetical protein